MSECREFTAVDFMEEFERPDGSSYLTLLPHISKTDGFFVAVFQKRGEQ